MLDQPVSRRGDFGNIVGVGRIPLSQGWARVASSVALGLGLEERDEAPGQIARIALAEPRLLLPDRLKRFAWATESCAALV